MSRLPHPFGGEPFRPANRTPGSLGRNDAANPDRHPSLYGDTPGSLGRSDHAAAGVHGFQGLLAQAGGGLPIGGWRRGDPLPLAPETVADLLAPAGAKLRIGGIWGDVTRGSVWLGSDGDRVIFSATSTDVIFYRRGGFYIQSAPGFIQEITLFPFVDAARRAAPLVRIVEVEMRLIMGIVAGVSGVGFVIVVGTEILEFLNQHRHELSIWRHQLSSILEARTILKQHAPTLYDRLFDAALRQALGDAIEEIPDAITADVVGFMVGVIIGTLGAKSFKGPLTVFTFIWVVIKSMVTRFLVSVVPGAITLTGKAYEEAASELIRQARDAGFRLSADDARKILEEIQRHPAEVRKAYEVLRSVSGENGK